MSASFQESLSLVRGAAVDFRARNLRYKQKQLHGLYGMDTLNSIENPAYT